MFSNEKGKTAVMGEGECMQVMGEKHIGRREYVVSEGRGSVSLQ